MKKLMASVCSRCLSLNHLAPETHRFLKVVSWRFAGQQVTAIGIVAMGGKGITNHATELAPNKHPHTFGASCPGPTGSS